MAVAAVMQSGLLLTHSAIRACWPKNAYSMTSTSSQTTFALKSLLFTARTEGYMIRPWHFETLVETSKCITSGRFGFWISSTQVGFFAVE
jgi:hypothetical protein